MTDKPSGSGSVDWRADGARSALRQAVIIIHGIGDQRPMDTLRSFILAALNRKIVDGEQPSRPGFYNNPDRMAGNFELRRFTLPSSESRPVTHFFEYYWQHQMRGNRIGHVTRWLLTLLFKSPSHIPTRLWRVWCAAWLAIALAVGFGVWSNAGAGDAHVTVPPYLRLALSLAILPFFSRLVSEYAGDAARYLSPRPENIDSRRRIRAGGIRLLRRLHESGEYDRIVLVGHSLGSVIAYDCITHYWQETHDRYERADAGPQMALDAVEEVARAVRDGDGFDVSEFQKLQARLWDEQRRLGNPWLISDLITMGSPLTHAQFLLARTPSEFDERVRERELISCPPVLDDDELGSITTTYRSGDQQRVLRVLHPGAQFACTRWTNLYFPGDLIGGPLAPAFGPGVRDIRVGHGSLGGMTSYLPTSHTKYWDSVRAAPPSGLDDAVSTLRAVLRLRSKTWLREQHVAPIAVLPDAREPVASLPISLYVAWAGLDAESDHLVVGCVRIDVDAATAVAPAADSRVACEVGRLPESPMPEIFEAYVVYAHRTPTCDEDEMRRGLLKAIVAPRVKAYRDGPTLVRFAAEALLPDQTSIMQELAEAWRSDAQSSVGRLEPVDAALPGSRLARGICDLVRRCLRDFGHLDETTRRELRGLAPHLRLVQDYDAQRFLKREALHRWLDEVAGPD